MKLQELAVANPKQQTAKVFESYFGSSVNFDSISPAQARGMLKRVRGLIAEHRLTTEFYRSERNPAYIKLVMMEQALTARLKETTMPPAAGTVGAPAGAPAQPGTIGAAGGQPAVAGAIAKDPKLAAALKKSAAGQSLNPEEQKLVAGAAMMQAESRLRRAMHKLNESEVQQAQVVLAAQDMVDKMQSMLEDTTEMQFKELPALVDSIRNQIGMEQATQFNTDVTGALQGLVQNLQGAKQQLETALGVVTGQPAALDTSMAASGMPGAAPAPMPGAEAGAELGAEVGAEMGAEMDAEEPAPAGAALGRARR